MQLREIRGNASDATAPIVAAFFDGLCLPRNPGGYACGGWYIPPLQSDGIHQLIEDGHTGSRFYGKGEGMTNNLAEYNAAIDCLRVIYATGYRGPVRLHGDSQLVVRQFTGEYACNSEALQPLLETLRHAATFFERLEMVWVPREQNDLADLASRHAYAKAMGMHS